AARRADVRAAAAGVRQALVTYLPRARIAARYLRLSSIESPSFGNLTFPVVLDQRALEAQIDVPISDYVLSVAHVVAAARHGERATYLLEEGQRRRVAADARIAYYTWARARLAAVVADDAVRQADLPLADVQHRFDADRANRADVTRVE